MKSTTAIIVLSALFLSACQNTLPNNNLNDSSSSILISATTSSPQDISWITYQDTQLNISIDYPFKEYTVSVLDDKVIEFNNNVIAIEGIQIGDHMPEGNSVLIYRTTDPLILDYLRQYKPFTGKMQANITEYDQFEFIGMADVYGYVTRKGDLYYIFQSTWGPNNPVSEKMLQSLMFI